MATAIQFIEKSHRILRGPIASSAAITTLYRLFNMGTGFVIVAILGAQLGGAGFGYFSLGLGVAMLIAAVVQSGMEIFLVRNVARYAAQSQWPELKGVSKFALSIVLVIAALSALFIAGSILYRGISHDDALFEVTLVGFAIAPIICLNSVATSILRGLMKMGRAYFPQLVLVQICHLITILFLLAIDALTPQTALISLAAAWSVATILSWVWTWQYWPESGRKSLSQMYIGDWSRSALLLLAGGAVGIMIGRIETIALAQFSTPLQIGLFAFAFRFAQLATFPGFALASGLDPVVATLHAKNDHKTLSERVLLATRLSVLGAALISIAIGVGARFIFPIIAPEFINAVPVVIILSIGFTMQAAAGRPFAVLSIMGQEKVSAIICTIAAIIGLLLVFVLAAKFGAIGTAIATAMIIAATPMTLAYTLWQRTGIRCDLLASFAAK